jgi:hypothetical protein
LFDKIDQIIVKTILSIEPLLWNGVQMFLPNAYQFNANVDVKQKNNNCFELLGFDILIDSKFSPWLIEVNLSPSLNTDSKLDFLIKSNLLRDLFNLVGLKSEEN